jgi:hypothetical protein
MNPRTPNRTGDRTENDHRLVFPAQALEEARRSAPRREPTSRHGSLSRLISNVDATLDRMQSQLNELAGDVENFRFPEPGTEDTTPPRAA